MLNLRECGIWYPGCQRGFFSYSEAAIVSGEAAIVILPREKKPSGRGSYKPHFHAILKPNTSLNRFVWDWCAFLIGMSARVATMRETAQINYRKMRKSETVRPNITSSIEARQSFNSFM